MIKKLLLIGVFLLLGGCSNTDVIDSEKDELIQQAEIIMEDLQAKNYEAIANKFSQFYLTKDTAKAIQEGWESQSTIYGEFIEVDRYIVTPLKDYMIVKIIVNYEQYKAQFTMTFLSNGKLAGVFFR